MSRTRRTLKWNVVAQASYDVATQAASRDVQHGLGGQTAICGTAEVRLDGRRKVR